FFQAEDGIRDDLVTGVQTCALPICLSSGWRCPMAHACWRCMRLIEATKTQVWFPRRATMRCASYSATQRLNWSSQVIPTAHWTRSEERRVGKECRGQCAESKW